MSQEKLSGIDFDTGTRVNRLFDRETLLDSVKKSNPFGKIKDLTQLEEAFGSLNEIPEAFKPIQNLDIKKGRISGDRAAVLQLNPNVSFKGLGSDEEIRQIEYSGLGGKDPKYEIVKKSAPYAGFPRSIAGAIDAVTGNTFGLDLDRRGQLGDKRRIVDISDATNYLVSPAQAKKVEQELEKAGFEGKTKSPLGNIDEITEAELAYQEKMNPILRQRRRDAAVDAQLQYIATEPIRQAFLNKAAEQAAQRGLRVRGALEAMPSNIQNIMSAKQGQRALASSAFAEEARALATQQDAATRFAGQGLGRRFG